MNPNIQSCSTIAEVRRALRDSLSARYGLREATEMARRVLMHLKGWDFSRLTAYEDNEASEFIKSRADEILNLLLKNTPIQYALGETTFYGLTLNVGPGVLVPRPETEELVDLIVKDNRESDLRVLDLCTGSGAIAIALARYLPFSKVTALDFSPEALSYAKDNASTLKTDISFIEDDIFKYDFREDEFDIIVSNPPYVDEWEKAEMEPNVLDYEPHEALFVPDDNPLLFYRRIALIASTSLKSSGRLYLEINPIHAEEIKNLLEEFRFDGIEIIKDIHGKNRFAKAVKK